MQCCRVTDDVIALADDGVSTIQHGKRTDGIECACQPVQSCQRAVPACLHGGFQAQTKALQSRSTNGKITAGMSTLQPARQTGEARASARAVDLAGTVQANGELVDALHALVQAALRMSCRQPSQQ